MSYITAQGKCPEEAEYGDNHIEQKATAECADFILSCGRINEQE
jgi:hypothetical protein